MFPTIDGYLNPIVDGFVICIYSWLQEIDWLLYSHFGEQLEQGFIAQVTCYMVVFMIIIVSCITMYIIYRFVRWFISLFFGR